MRRTLTSGNIIESAEAKRKWLLHVGVNLHYVKRLSCWHPRAHHVLRRAERGAGTKLHPMHPYVKEGSLRPIPSCSETVLDAQVYLTLCPMRHV